ncbi:MAG: ABC-2 transporter permease [Actinobacteria bacterium]|nr:ABC-2 transporter permease [Actinomycetota bacterium]
MSRVALILRKDLRILFRSPLLLGVLIAYPLLVAGLVGLVAGYGSSKPRVALVDEDHLPQVVSVGGHSFRIQDAIDEVGKNVHLVRMQPGEARRALSTGRIVATLTIPPGFLADLRSGLHAPSILYQTTRGGISSRVTQQVQALVYGLNRQLQSAYVKTDLHYVQLIVNGGKAVFLGRTYDVLGLERMQKLLAELPPGPQRTRIAEFARIAGIALTQTGNLLSATANPIGLERAREHSRSSLLSAQVQSYALALTITFLALLLAAGAIASERDENAIGRLRRGLVSMGELVTAKVALAAVVALALGLAIALVFGLIVEAGGVAGGEPWQRLPLLAVGLLLAGGALGALGTLLGALARETRTASLVAVLVVMPIVFLGLVPSEIVPVAGWISDALPFAHAVRYFSASLYDASPWATVGRELAWLVGLGLVFGLLARAATRRLLA